MPDLAERLDKLRAEGAPAKAIVLLQTDAGTPVGIERQVTEMVLGKGFRLAMVGANAPGRAGFRVQQPDARVMAERVSIKHKRKEATGVGVSAGASSRESSFPKWFAIVVVGGAFAFFLTSVRIRVAPPAPWATHKASVIQVTDDAEGRALTLRAREGGPFPSRFDPSAWEGAAAMEQAAFEAARWTPPPYVPVLRTLPDEVTAASAACGQRRANPAETPARSHAPPRLPRNSGWCRSFIRCPGSRPRQCRASCRPSMACVDAAMTAEPWRFLVRLDAAGTVQDCVSLAGGDEAGPPPLEVWLRRVSFNPEPAKPSRWIAVGVGFTNQPADGTDAR